MSGLSVCHDPVYERKDTKMSEKTRFALWIEKETLDLVRQNYIEDNCKTQSEYIAKAILFYTGYLNTNNAMEYLPEVLSEILEGKLDMLGSRIGRLLFKLAVECNISNHILAADTDMDVPTYERLRGRSVREVKETNGKISFKDDLIFQRSV